MLRKKAFSIIALITASFGLSEFGFAVANADVVLSGEVTRADYQNYKLLPFKVPAGTRRLTIDFAYDTREVKTTIDIGLFDTHGLRGWAGGDKSTFTISDVDATP